MRAARAAAGPVPGLQRLGAARAGPLGRRAARVLARLSARAAHACAAARRASPRRRRTARRPPAVDRVAGRYARAAEGARAPRAGVAVRGADRRVLRVAAPAERAERSRRRDAVQRPRARGAGKPRRVLRQRAAGARARTAASVLRGVVAAGARRSAPRVPAPRTAVRPDRRTVRERVGQPVPDDVRPRRAAARARRAHGRRRRPARRAARRRAAGADRGSVGHVA